MRYSFRLFVNHTHRFVNLICPIIYVDQSENGVLCWQPKATCTYMWTSRREDEFSSFFRSSPRSQISSPYSPDFYMFLPCFLANSPVNFSSIFPYSPDFYMFTSRMCNLHHVHLGQGNKMQFEWHTCGYFESLHSAEVFYSHFKICFNNFIYPPWVDYFTLGWWLFEYLLASTVNFKIYIFKIN